MIKKLLTNYITSNVVIAMDMTQTVMMANGDTAEIPLVVEGVLLDFDAKYLLIGNNSNQDDVELINRDLVVSIKPVDLIQEEFDALMDKDGKGTIN